MTAEERQKLYKQIDKMAEILKGNKLNDRNRERVWLFSNALQLGLTLQNSLQPVNQQNNFQPA